jgi:hypothetical protein
MASEALDSYSVFVVCWRQFERDMRALVAFFVDRSSAAVRSKLTRLTQLSRLLNLDMPMEV